VALINTTGASSKIVHPQEDISLVRGSAVMILMQTFLFLKNGVFWDITPCGSCKNRRSEEPSAFIRVTRIGELGTTLAVTSSSLGMSSQRALFLVH
jgi:hypothetical protein